MPISKIRDADLSISLFSIQSSNTMVCESIESDENSVGVAFSRIVRIIFRAMLRARRYEHIFGGNEGANMENMP